MSAHPSWSETVQSLTEKLSVENLPHQVRSCRTMEEKVEKIDDAFGNHLQRFSCAGQVQLVTEDRFKDW